MKFFCSNRCLRLKFWCPSGSNPGGKVGQLAISTSTIFVNVHRWSVPFVFMLSNLWQILCILSCIACLYEAERDKAQGLQTLKQVPSALLQQPSDHLQSNSKMELVGHSIALISYPFQDHTYGGIPAYVEQVCRQSQIYVGDSAVWHRIKVWAAFCLVCFSDLLNARACTHVCIHNDTPRIWGLCIDIWVCFVLWWCNKKIPCFCMQYYVLVCFLVQRLVRTCGWNCTSYLSIYLFCIIFCINFSFLTFI